MLDLSSLRKRRDELEKGYKEAVRVSNEMEGKMISRYDTQKEEWAREAEMLQKQMLLVEEQIVYLSELPVPQQMERVEVGHIVKLHIDDDDPEDYLLVETLGGAKIGPVKLLSTESSIGKAICN